MPITEYRPADPAVHALAIRLARACRRIIQAVLRGKRSGATPTANSTS